MRKFIIGISAFGFIVIMFLAYAFFMDTTPPIEVPKTHEVQDLPMPDLQEGPQRLADELQTQNIQKLKYYKYNKVTKEIEAVYGFNKLLTPGMESSRWEVEKPYLILYRSNYQCRIDSDTGTFQTEKAGSGRSPKDAQLDGNVIIHITPTSSGKITETVIEMDDLTFSSERSEFATDGPVNIKSDQVMLEGYGMNLLFDTASGRIDFLRIQDLEELRIFETVPPEAAPQTALQTEKKDSAIQPKPSQPVTPVDSPEATAADQPKTVSPAELYQCILKDNVEIEYGDKLVVAGADEVNINNIIFSGTKPKPDEKKNAAGASIPVSVPAAVPQKQVAQNTSPPEKDPPDASASSSKLKSREEVVVRCDGGIIFKPMKGDIRDVSLADPELSVEMSGNPLQIERISADTFFGREPLASCGMLTYTPMEDILRMFTHEHQPEIVLNAYESRSYIQTLGNVWWNRKSRKANIAGPGKAFLGGSDADKKPTEVSFKGAMDLIFADTGDLNASPTIQTINLTGGMDAVFKQNGWYKTMADSATLEFGSANSLSEAHLLGQVQFESLEKQKPQRAVSESAIFKLGPENSLSTARMQGGVVFESTQDDTRSRAQADTATFHFDQNKIRTADLDGAVSFLSDTGKMTSSHATIDFEPDEAGAMQPKTMHTKGEATLETVSEPQQSPPAKFQARKIDYDLQTGAGVAYGPVRFRFYQPADETSKSEQPWIPVTVTADRNAEFIADETRTVKQVVFNGNVLASRNQNFSDYVQLDDLHGESLTVDLDKGHTESIEISRNITMSGGNVYVQSQQLQEEKINSNVKLYCSKIVFNDREKRIFAYGPGKIEMDNSRIAPGETSSSDGVDTSKPCYVIIDGFDTIDWDLTQEKIIAEGNLNQLKLAYIPLLNGKPEKYVYVNSLRFDLTFGKDANGKSMLNRVFTDRTIVYTEKDRNNDKRMHSIIGQTLDYDRTTGNGWLKIEGTPSVPCNVDGLRTPLVYVNPVTGEIKTTLSTVPGVLKSKSNQDENNN